MRSAPPRSSFTPDGTPMHGRAGPDPRARALKAAAVTAVTSGLKLHAGHGLNYQNVAPVARLNQMAELNIGHSIISRAVFVGMTQAVREMKDCIDLAVGGEVSPGEGINPAGSGSLYACQQ